MKAIVTVVGKDQVGIIAGVCNTLAEENINVLDISQTIMQGYFTMMMVVDLSACTTSFDQLSERLGAFGEGGAWPSASSGRTSSTPCTRSEVREHARY